MRNMDPQARIGSPRTDVQGVRILVSPLRVPAPAPQWAVGRFDRLLIEAEFTGPR